MTFRNPFGFWSVMGFAAFLGATIVAARAISEWLGAAGAIGGAIVLGLVDVDSVTVSMARLTPDPLTLDHVAYAILAAVTSNVLSKVAISAGAGDFRFVVQVGTMSLLCLIAAGAALALTLAMRPI